MGINICDGDLFNLEREGGLSISNWRRSRPTSRKFDQDKILQPL